MSANAIIENLKKRIAGFEGGAEMYEYGTVLSISDGIAKISGLAKCQSSEMVAFDSGAIGLALTLRKILLERLSLETFLKSKKGRLLKEQIKSFLFRSAIVLLAAW